MRPLTAGDMTVALALLLGTILAFFYQQGSLLGRAMFFHYWDDVVAVWHAAALVLLALSFLVASLRGSRSTKQVTLLLSSPVSGVLFVKLELWIAAILSSIDVHKSFLAPNALTFAIGVCVLVVVSRCVTRREDLSVVAATFLASTLVAIVLFTGMLHPQLR